MQQVDANTIHVEHPNGTLSEFRKTSSKLGTLICGEGGLTGCWRFHEMRDYYGNYVRVTYSQSGSTETWSISDSTGRTTRSSSPWTTRPGPEETPSAAPPPCPTATSSVT